MASDSSDDRSGLIPDGELMPPPPPPPLAPPPALRHGRGRIGRRGATAALDGGLVVGGIAGGYVISQAAASTRTR
jgi:hypothetical protein